MAVKNSLHLPEALEDLIAKASPQLLKELVTRFAGALMSAEADAMCGAKLRRGEPRAGQPAQRL